VASDAVDIDDFFQGLKQMLLFCVTKTEA